MGYRMARITMTLSEFEDHALVVTNDKTRRAVPLYLESFLSGLVIAMDACVR